MKRALWVVVVLTGALASCGPAPPPMTSGVPPQPRATGTPGGASGAPASGQPGAPAQRVAPNAEPTLDVGLAADLDSIVVMPSQRLGLYLTSIEHGDKPLGESGGPARVRRVESHWEISWGEAGATPETSVLDPRDTLWVSGLGKDAAASRLGWSGKTWRGLGKVFVGPRGRLTLALRLPLEIYLLGVVPGEIGGLSPALLQAGRAQAIAARSYTLFYRARRASEGFDLYGSVEDQVYGSIETERELATQCVTSTSGRVALHDGVPIRANYCSTCGGITADVWEAWPNDPMPYLLSHRDLGAGGDFCAASPHYRWRETWTATEFLADVTRFAPAQGIPLPLTGLGELVDVAVESRSRSGRAWRLVVRGSTGELHVPAYSIRQVLRRGGNPSAILRSNLFKIDVLRDGSGRATTVVASGAGSGHGVGLCQTGALGMARAGRSAEAILQHYYPGIDLRRLY